MIFSDNDSDEIKIFTIYILELYFVKNLFRKIDMSSVFTWFLSNSNIFKTLPIIFEI